MREPAADPLTPKQDQAIVALLNEPTVLKAAAAVDVSETTLHRWLNNPEFMAAYRKARQKVFQHGMSLAQRYIPHAVQVLAKTMTDPSAPHTARVSAASAILKFTREAIEIDDLQARLQDLEMKVEAKPKRAFVDDQWSSDAPPPLSLGEGDPP